ncbi:MAG: hypothetical protein ACI4B3_09160 [Prevotella sp.]
MNIKIKSAGVTCLIGDDYDRVYTALKNQLNDEHEQLFTERIPGHEYLQWELPGDGWTPLSEGDPLMAQEVRQELLRRKQIISQRFGKNQEMAQRILSVPDESYVYYKANSAGNLLIKLTAWGYRYPERVGCGGITGTFKPKGDTQSVSIHIVYDNEPLPNKEFFINGFKRVTDNLGIYNVGELPIGYKFEIGVDGNQQIVDVTSGHDDIKIDLTLFASVEIRATLDGHPYEGVTASLSYWGHELKLSTDSNGKVFAKVPKDPNNGMCTVSIENDYQQLALVEPITVFTFNINTIKEDDQIEENKLENPIGNTDEEVGKTIESSKQNDDNIKVDEEKEETLEQDEIPDTRPDLPVDGQQRSSSLTLEILVALSIVALVVFTYLFCYGMLFG